MVGHVWRRDAGDGAARQEEKRKAKEKVHGHGEGGLAGGWCRGQEEMETDDPLWRPLTGTAERRRCTNLNVNAT
uniref:Uncharacterized protein n=1 Tax=Anguilla anguilla TaxID=7936 RepID=A0A0E9SZ62_ANGAN